MSQMLHGAMAKAMLDDLHRTSARRQRATEAAVSRKPAPPDAIELRPDRLADRWRLRALAAAAREEPLTGPALVAVVDGEIVAALETTTRRVVTEPGGDYGRALELLWLRAEQLGVRRRRRFRRRRLATA